MTCPSCDTGSGAVLGARRVRYRVVGLTVLLAMVTYFDRSCISVLAPRIRAELSISESQMSYVFSAFAVAYAAFEIPTAWWADRIGTRSVLTRIVLWWSSFTIATASAFNYFSLLVVRFLFGMGEAGAWPSAARAFSRWIPQRERGTVQGIFFTGAHLAGGLTPLLVMGLVPYITWRGVFVVFGLVGFVWVAVWHGWFRDEPSEHPAVSPEELAEIRAGRRDEQGRHDDWQAWKQLLRSRNLAPLCLMYFPNSYAFYFCLTWMPTYLAEEHQFQSLSLGVFAGLPFVLSIGSDLLGGVSTDLLSARYGLRVGRAGLGAAAYLVAGASLVMAGATSHGVLAAVLIALATAASMFTLGAAWGTCLDIGGPRAAVVSAAMNTSGQVGSILSPIVSIHLKDYFGGWSAPLYLMGGLFLAAALCWGLIDPRRPVFD